MKTALRYALLSLFVPMLVTAQDKPVTPAAPAKAVAGPLLVIDDIVIGNGLIFQMQDMEALNVVSFEVLKSELAVRLYGERAKSGAVIIRTQGTGAATATPDARWTVSPGYQMVGRLMSDAPAGKEPLLLVDGVALGVGTNGLMLEKYLDAANIASVRVNKNSEEGKYGSQAVNGTIMITTKPIKK
jgi:hypothetical protein